MKKTLLILLFFSVYRFSTSQPIDTVTYRYKNIDDITYSIKVIQYWINDTMMISKTGLVKNNSHLFEFEPTIDTFIVKEREWLRYFNGKLNDYMSIDKFNKGEVVNVYTDNSNPKQLYLQYQPIENIEVDEKKIYIYKVYEMNIDSKMDYWFYLYFDFEIGMLRRVSYQEDYILEDYEKVNLLKSKF